MPLLETLQSIIEEPSESTAISRLLCALNQNSALLDEVDENGNNLLMQAILLKKIHLALSILSFMESSGFDNRTHQNLANKNALLLAIDNQLPLVAKKLVVLKNTFSLVMLTTNEYAFALGNLLLNVSPLSDNPDFHLEKFKIFCALLISYLSNQKIQPSSPLELKNRYFTSVFQLLVTLFPQIQPNANFNSNDIIRLAELINRPLSFDLIEEIVQVYQKNEIYPGSIISDQKTTLIICALLYDDKNLIDYITNLSCLDEAPQLDLYLHKMWLNPASTDTPDLKLPIDITIQKQFHEIRSLFCNPKLCLDLLADLDAQLGNFYREQGIELPQVNTEKPIYTGLFYWPTPEKWRGPKTKGALNTFLLQKEREYGINTHPHAPGFFVGGVAEKEANCFVYELNIFKEYKKASTPLHGMELHRLQWHLIMLAIEKELFSSITKDDIPKLLRASVSLYKSDDMSLWASYFDAYPPSKKELRDSGASCPNFLHSLLLFSNLHYLSACLFEKYTKSLEFLAKINGHHSSARECILFDLWRNTSFTPLKHVQSPLSYYSREEVEFYHEKYPLNDNPPSDFEYIFFKKSVKSEMINEVTSQELRI